MRVTHLVIRDRQAEVRDVARAPAKHLEPLLLQRPGQPRRREELVDRLALAADPLADHVDPAAQREVRLVGEVARVASDVDAAVPPADDDHPLARQLLGPAVVVRVHLDTVELTRERRLGPARVPVVAVGDHDRVVRASLAGRELDLPTAVVIPRHVLDRGLERDRVANPEVVDVAIEVVADVAPRRIVVRAQREVRVRHPRTRGVHLQGRVTARAPVRVLEHPEPADHRPRLEAVERHASLVKHLRRRDPTGAGSDHAHPRERGIGLDRALGAARRRLAANQIRHRPSLSGARPRYRADQRTGNSG